MFKVIIFQWYIHMWVLLFFVVLCIFQISYNEYCIACVTVMGSWFGSLMEETQHVYKQKTKEQVAR